MVVDSSARILSLPGLPSPQVDESAFVAPGAVVVGQVSIGERASVWYSSVLRAEAEPIVIGAESNLQDNVSCHVDAGYPLTVGRGVSVGHGAVLHGCTIDDDVLVGMSATVMNGAVIGRESLVAAGALVLEGSVIPPRSLVAGVPGKVRRELTDDEVAGIRRNSRAYLGHAALHAGAAGAAQDA
ncbi:MAG: gamma carbonic anhydrase family protein [Cryobacterium sp.]|jgi:carbonic anhydrase/acetyltransferase-like protein (isoleucine patch superfamily)|nr:gamma carbonic anhydrase family protein [Cryobacterium sp.]